MTEPYTKIIYIAGPYMSEDPHQIDQNILNASEYAIRVWELGYVALCPHKNTSNFERFEGPGTILQDAWYRGDIALLSKCDGILMIKGWQKSNGAIKEKKYAELHGIPVYYHLEEIPEID